MENVKCVLNLLKFCKFPELKKSVFLQINFSEKISGIKRKFQKFRVFFSNSAVSGACLSERAQKMLQNGLLDVQKLAELAENEPLEVPKIWKIIKPWIYYACHAWTKKRYALYQGRKTSLTTSRTPFSLNLSGI